MAARYQYTPTPVSEISKAIANLFSGMEGEGQFTFSASSNVIVAVGSKAQLDALEPILDTLSLIHPSRFFVLVADDTVPGITTEISARCQLVAKGQHVCSEIIRVSFPRTAFLGVPSVICANAKTGVATELFVFDSTVNRDLLKLVMPLTDTVLFDSSCFETSWDAIEELSGEKQTLVDFEWVSLAVWREQIRRMFASGIVREAIPRLDKISLRVRARKGVQAPASAYLFCGWLLERLGLHPESSVEPGVFSCISASRGRIALEIVTELGTSDSTLEEVTMKFRPMSGLPGGEVLLKRNQALDAFVNIGTGYKVSAPLEDDTMIGRLNRYFMIGESIVNYRPALREAQELQALSGRKGK